MSEKIPLTSDANRRWTREICLFFVNFSWKRWKEHFSVRIVLSFSLSIIFKTIQISIWNRWTTTTIQTLIKLQQDIVAKFVVILLFIRIMVQWHVHRVKCFLNEMLRLDEFVICWKFSLCSFVRWFFFRFRINFVVISVIIVKWILTIDMFVRHVD